jgi:hypothetical protein
MRNQIGAMMLAGLKTKTQPLPETHVEFGRLLAQVRELAPGDLKAKLKLTGFVDKPYGPDKMRCQECMYYLVHSKWCDLPELSVPVEPDWWCRLWRI